VPSKNGAGALQKNCNDGELRYACNIPGDRRQRARAAASSLLTKGLLRTSAIPASASASGLTSVVHELVQGSRKSETIWLGCLIADHCRIKSVRRDPARSDCIGRALETHQLARSSDRYPIFCNLDLFCKSGEPFMKDRGVAVSGNKQIRFIDELKGEAVRLIMTSGGTGQRRRLPRMPVP
jgi:hypothetical protein